MVAGVVAVVDFQDEGEGEGEKHLVEDQGVEVDVVVEDLRIIQVQQIMVVEVPPNSPNLARMEQMEQSRRHDHFSKSFLKRIYINKYCSENQ